MPSKHQRAKSGDTWDRTNDDVRDMWHNTMIKKLLLFVPSAKTDTKKSVVVLFDGAKVHFQHWRMYNCRLDVGARIFKVLRSGSCSSSSPIYHHLSRMVDNRRTSARVCKLCTNGTNLEFRNGWVVLCEHVEWCPQGKLWTIVYITIEWTRQIAIRTWLEGDDEEWLGAHVLKS